MSLQRYCQYMGGDCEVSQSSIPSTEGFFIYGSTPPAIGTAVMEAVKQLRRHSNEQSWSSWENLSRGGQIVLCDICQAVRQSNVVIADITTLNFNVLFEVGFAIGLGKPIVPIRETSYADASTIAELGIFDTLKYETYHNSNDVASIANRGEARFIFSLRPPDTDKTRPIFLARSPVSTDASILLVSRLKKSYFGFRLFDATESPRLSLHDAYREVMSSIAVIGHLIDPDRQEAKIHNARVAFLCGMGVAAGKAVLMLQEGYVSQPIDYRDIVVPYLDTSIVSGAVERILRETARRIQSVPPGGEEAPKGILEQIDLGDIVAENEIPTLRRHFVKTPAFLQAVQGHARLVVGRKGSGKTAIFYGIRTAVGSGRNLVLDLRPEGHQFAKLRETVLATLSEGYQLHTLTAFWNYLLFLELAHKILQDDLKTGKAWRNQGSLAAFNELKAAYEGHAPQQEGDFSERLMGLVKHITVTFPKEDIGGAQITNAIYRGDIRPLANAVIANLDSRESVWLLFDNLDKGWPTASTRKEDIAILRCLLEATRKLQHELQGQGIDFHSIVFIRKDIHDLLVDQTPDRGKEPAATVDWTDVEMMKALLLRRLQTGPVRGSDFDEVWLQLFEAHVRGENSFKYILDRTFAGPRNLLNFVRKAMQVAISRDHRLVQEQDILEAEKSYSEDIFNDVRYEIRDVYPDYPTILDQFIGAKGLLAVDDVTLYALEAGVPEDQVGKLIDILLWFSFLGIAGHGGEGHYSHEYQYNLTKLKASAGGQSNKELLYVLHPAFSRALET